MKEYKLNYYQLKTLHSVLKITKKQLTAKVGIQYMRYNRLLETGDFKVEELVNLCNRLRVPLSTFISVEEEDVMRANIQVGRDQWQDIRYFPQRLMQRATKERLETTHISRAIGKTRITVTKWLDGDITIEALLLMCNRLGWNLQSFISDPTLPHIVSESTASTALLKENAMLRKEIAELKARIAELEGTTYGLVAESMAEYKKITK